MHVGLVVQGLEGMLLVARLQSPFLVQRNLQVKVIRSVYTLKSYVDLLSGPIELVGASLRA